MSKNDKGLSIVGKDVPNVLALLDAELAKLKKITDCPPRTTGQLDLDNGNTINIQTETKVENLVKGLSSLIGRKYFYDKAQEALGIKEIPVFSVGGTIEHWIEDIKLRLAILQHEDKRAKLEGFKVKMSGFLSQEDQKGMLLDEMSKYLSK